MMSAHVQHPATGIRFALKADMKMLLASIALSALVLWALSCGGIRA